MVWTRFAELVHQHVCPPVAQSRLKSDFLLHKHKLTEGSK